jgi:hypothetical protein
MYFVPQLQRTRVIPIRLAPGTSFAKESFRSTCSGAWTERATNRIMIKELIRTVSTTGKLNKSKPIITNKK